MSLNAREQALAIGLGTVIFAVLNLIFLPKLIAYNKAAGQKKTELTGQIAAAQGWIAKRQEWNARKAWLDQTEPPLRAARGESATQLEELQHAAREAGLTIADVQLLQLAPTEFYHPVGARLTVKGPWAGLVTFVGGLQNPGLFNVIPRFSIRSDDPPPNVQCELEIQRWLLAPKESTP